MPKQVVVALLLTVAVLSGCGTAQGNNQGQTRSGTGQPSNTPSPNATSSNVPSSNAPPPSTAASNTTLSTTHGATPDYIIVSRTKMTSGGNPQTRTLTIRNKSDIRKLQQAMAIAQQQTTSIHCHSIVAGLSYTLTIHYPKQATQKFTNHGGACMALTDANDHVSISNPGSILTLLNHLVG